MFRVIGTGNLRETPVKTGAFYIVFNILSSF